MKNKYRTCSYIGFLFLLFGLQSIACTGFLAGKDAMADGYILHARNEDLKGINPKRFEVIESKLHPKGTMFTNPETGFTIEMPRKTYRYSIVPDADQSAGVFGEAGFNEFGLSVSTTVSARANDEILKYDPYVEGGITEPDMASIMLMQAKNAREAIKIIADIVETKGAGEGNVFVVADKEEMWYMEIYTGHQYVAVKVPDDVYAVIPNAFYLGSYDFKSKDVISSKDIETLPKKYNLDKEKNGKFHLALTYREKHSPYNVVRIHMGQNYFSPSEPTIYDEEIAYELFRKPDKKIELKEVMDFLRYRYEGSEYDLEKDGNQEVRPIGVDTNLEAHIFQMKKDAPSIMWLAMGTVEHSVFVPFYEHMTKTPKYYLEDASDYNDNSMYWTFKKIHLLARNDRKVYGSGVKEYFSNQEKEFIKLINDENKQFEGISLKEKYELANKLSKEKAELVKKDADKMFIELFKFQGNITDSKKAKNTKVFKFENKK